MVGTANTSELQLFERKDLIPKQNPYKARIHAMLNGVYQKIGVRQRPQSTEEILPEESSVPHRFSGEDTLASRKQAVRSILSTGILPKYRQVPIEVSQQKEVTRVNPTVRLHVFCEIGDYASLDPNHLQKLLALGEWSPKTGESLEVVLHPLDITVAQSKLRCKEVNGCEQIVTINAQDNEAVKNEKMITAYANARKTKPAMAVDFKATESILLDDPFSDIKSEIQKIDLEETGNIPMFALLMTSRYNADFRKAYKYVIDNDKKASSLNIATTDIPVTIMDGADKDNFSVALLDKR